MYVDKAFIIIAVVLHIVHFMHRSLLRETSVVGERIGLLESFSRRELLSPTSGGVTLLSPLVLLTWLPFGTTRSLETNVPAFII